MRRVLFIVVASYLISSMDAQFDTTTDPGRCCKRAPNKTHADSMCRSTKLTANQFQQSITTPNFPKAFEADTFCRWEIYSMPGRRILLDFRNIHLVSKDNNECVSQRLMIRSPLTGLTVGPFCGHDGLPNIVTTGNYVVVELQSPQPTNGRQYKGFQIVYMETVQATSIGLRPPDWSDGMYLEYRRPGPPSRPSRYNPNRNKNRSPSTKHPPTTPTKNSQKPKEPSKKPPKDRVLSNSNNLKTIVPAYPYIPAYRVPTRIREKPKDEEGMGTDVIVGIVVGGILLVGIISVVVAKLGFYRSDKRKKREEQDKEMAKQTPPLSDSSLAYKTSPLPSYWKAVQAPDARPSRKHRDAETSRKSDHAASKQPAGPMPQKSRIKPERSRAAKPDKTPISRARTRTREEKGKARPARPSDRAERKRRTKKSGDSCRNPGGKDQSEARPMRRRDGRPRKKTNGRADR